MCLIANPDDRVGRSRRRLRGLQNHGLEGADSRALLRLPYVWTRSALSSVQNLSGLRVGDAWADCGEQSACLLSCSLIIFQHVEPGATTHVLKLLSRQRSCV